FVTLDRIWFPDSSMPLNIENPDFASIGGGLLNCAHMHYATIGGGRLNHAVGAYSTIPGGMQLTAYDHQTAVGRFNLQYDNSMWPTDRLANVLSSGNPPTFPTDRNYPIFVVGNGGRLDHTSKLIRSNAYEISDNGHAIVFDNLGKNEGATAFTPPDTSFFSTRPAIRGARYMDNTPIAWGRFEANKLITSFGVDSTSTITKRTGLGVYRIVLDYVDPYSSSPILIEHGSSVVATIENKDDHNCLFINASPVFIDNGKNIIEIRISKQTINPLPTPTLICNSFDGDFMFQVLGRE
ncbi:MAG TPA: hypothetical protein VIX80_05220, partial [Candidatus Kapabacteria bacterium]